MSEQPAFPTEMHHDTNGMTLRDYFAAKAMQGWVSNPDNYAYSNEHIAEQCYAIADAMMKARKSED